MHSNIDQLLERGECLDSITATSEDLAATAVMFKKGRRSFLPSIPMLSPKAKTRAAAVQSVKLQQFDADDDVDDSIAEKIEHAKLHDMEEAILKLSELGSDISRELIDQSAMIDSIDTSIDSSSRNKKKMRAISKDGASKKEERKAGPIAEKAVPISVSSSSALSPSPPPPSPPPPSPPPPSPPSPPPPPMQQLAKKNDLHTLADQIKVPLVDSLAYLDVSFLVIHRDPIMSTSSCPCQGGQVLKKAPSLERSPSPQPQPPSDPPPSISTLMGMTLARRSTIVRDECDSDGGGWSDGEEEEGDIFALAPSPPRPPPPSPSPRPELEGEVQSEKEAHSDMETGRRESEFSDRDEFFEVVRDPPEDLQPQAGVFLSKARDMKGKMWRGNVKRVVAMVCCCPCVVVYGCCYGASVAIQTCITSVSAIVSRWVSKNKLFDNVLADTENAFQTLAKFLVLLVVSDKSCCWLYRTVMRPVNWIVSMAVVTSSSVTLILPSFFTLLVVRTTTTEKESTAFGHRQEAIRVEKVDQSTLRWIRIVVRSAPMASFLLVLPYVLVYRVFPSTPGPRIVAYLLGYISTVLLLQVGG